LTTNVLRVANAAAFSGGARTESLPQAIVRLGLRESIAL